MRLTIKPGVTLKDIITQLAKDKQAQKKPNEENKSIQSIVQMETPIDFENAFIDDKDSDSIHCDSLEEGLLTCLNNLGKVDIEYISKITGYTLQDVINNLRGTILQNPNTWDEVFYKGFELRDSYLVGNLRIKLAEAKEANTKYPGVFDANIEAIKEASKNQQLIEPDDIYFALGSPWIPTDVIEDFVKYLLDINSVIVKHDLMSGSCWLSL